MSTRPLTSKERPTELTWKERNASSHKLDSEVLAKLEKNIVNLSEKSQRRKSEREST